jgi:hypothetical protein
LNNLIAVMLVMAMSAAWAPAASGSDAPKRFDASERAKQRMARERQFLYRAVEELNRSQGYVQATMQGLEKQIAAVDILEPSRRERDLRSFLEWYQAYAEFLGGNLADFEADLSEAYSDQPAAVVKPDRYDTLIDGCARLGSQLDEQISYLEKLSNWTAERIDGLRLALDYILSSAFLEDRNRDKDKDKDKSRDRDKKQSQPGTDRRKNELYDRYRDITEAEIAMMQIDLKNMVELQQHYVVLIEIGRMELFWITRKTGDYEALSRLAKAIGRDAPKPIEEASDRVIKTYDSDIAYFKRKAEDISRARSQIVPAGTLRMLDRREELSGNYDQMKSRYEHHVIWLAEQSGAYRADLIELRKDK